MLNFKSKALSHALKRRAKRVGLTRRGSQLKGSAETRVTLLEVFRNPGVTLAAAAIDRAELQDAWQQLSDAQRAELAAGCARAEARLRRPDMSAEALRAREHAAAEWETQHGEVVTAFTGMRRTR